MNAARVVGTGALAAMVVAAAACSSFTAAEEPLVRVEAGANDAAAPDPSTTNDASSPDAADAGHLTSGCADGTREEFFLTPMIAACEGAWGRPGIRADAVVSCDRAAGNDGTAAGGCAAEDLCARGWHLCRDHADVAVHGGANVGPCAAGAGDAGVFFATAQASEGLNECTTSNIGLGNDVIGCGDATRPEASCSPLNAVISTSAHPANFFFNGDVNNERASALHGTGPGGVLCCTDE